MVNIDTTTPQQKALKGVADAIISGDVKIVEPLLSEDYTFRTFPKSAELPDLTKEEYLQKFGALFGIFSKIEITFHEIIEAPRKLVTHHSFLFTAPGGVTIDYEAVAIFTFVDEGGELKIIDCSDFTDPIKRGEMYAEGLKALERGAFAA